MLRNFDLLPKFDNLTIAASSILDRRACRIAGDAADRGPGRDPARAARRLGLSALAPAYARRGPGTAADRKRSRGDGRIARRPTPPRRPASSSDYGTRRVGPEMPSGPRE